MTPSKYWLMTSLAFWVPSNAGRTSAAAADPADGAEAGALALAKAASRDTGASPGREAVVIVYKMAMAYSFGISQGFWIHIIYNL